MQFTFKANQQSGFTLIEVLVALLIVSLGVGSVIQVTAKHVSNISELEKRMLASWVASNQIAEIRHDAKIDKIRSGGKTERSQLGGHEWRSRIKIEKTDVERVFLLTVEVADDNHADKKVYANMTSAVTDRL
ncbi:MAG: general secretion pathway protein I [Arenicella sp.]|jgi:general secretion pathway protein I